MTSKIGLSRVLWPDGLLAGFWGIRKSLAFCYVAYEGERGLRKRIAKQMNCDTLE
jgi:hypothetical protein